MNNMRQALEIEAYEVSKEMIEGSFWLMVLLPRLERSPLFKRLDSTDVHNRNKLFMRWHKQAKLKCGF
jgi:hypothetical protein